MNIDMRLEEENDYLQTEAMTRDAFWDLYKPGCDEHLVLHRLRGSEAFIPELDYVACGGETVTLEGDGRPGRVVIIEFPSLKDAEEWYRSEDYRRIKRLREGAATGTLVAVQGEVRP